MRSYNLISLQPLMDNILFYALCVIAVIAGVWLIKKCVSCLLRLAIILCVIALLVYVYLTYFAV